MKIDGVSVEPSPADDPYAMGPVALDIDCDLDALAQKVKIEREREGEKRDVFECSNRSVVTELSNLGRAPFYDFFPVGSRAGSKYYLHQLLLPVVWCRRL